MNQAFNWQAVKLHWPNGELLNHHSPDVDKITLTLIAAVIWKSTGEIDARERLGETANVLWFYVGDKKYATKYNHEDRVIELRDRTQSGNVIGKFDNNSTHADVINTFNSL